MTSSEIFLTCGKWSAKMRFGPVIN